MEIFGSNRNGKEMQKYKLIIFNHSAEMVRDVKDTSLGELIKLLNISAKKTGIEIYNVDFVGLYLSKKNGKRFIHSFPFDDKGEVILPDQKDRLEKQYQKPIEIDPRNTILMPRGMGTVDFTSSRSWIDTVRQLELEGFITIPSVYTWNICTSKYLTDIMCRKEGLKTPKTVALSYSEDTARAVDELGTGFPMVLKTSTGSQTGVGVTVVESERSLHASVQMLKLYKKYLPLLIQEYIKIEYDVRVVILDGEILGAMKREVIEGDIRSNASLGAKTGVIELTELEKRDSIKAAEVVKGRLVGVDFLPAKDREKEQPYILEVNSMPGFGGIEKIKKGLTVNILNHFKDEKHFTQEETKTDVVRIEKWTL